jgi:choline dehydrogenase-like flavoprotein
MAPTSYDIIIIGTGAGGGTLLHALAGTGRRILVLERGGYVPREPQNWNPRVVNALGRYHTKEVWKTKDTCGSWPS